MRWWQVLLFPFAIIYDLITRFRNHLYNIGYKPSFAFEANVVAVGNLTVGGTGKTPMVTYLVQHFLNEGKSVATLSRGYGRKTNGFRICRQEDTPATVGDEPFTYFERFGAKIMVAVGEDRALAIPFMLAEEPELDVILLDDAYQHRSVKPSLNILLTTAERPFWRDFVLPSGRLRESRRGADRADIIVVTKNMKKQTFPELQKWEKPSFSTTVKYGAPVFFGGNKLEDQVVVVSGLANNQPFVDYVRANFQVRSVFEFADHHAYSASDLAKILRRLTGATLLTTHKDAVKLRQFPELNGYSCAYIPINVHFIHDEERFLQLVDESLQDYSSNR